MRATTRLYVWGALLLLAFSGACGYRMARFDNPALEGMTTIAIPYFENQTYEPGIDAVFTYAFVNKFTSTHRLQVVGVDDADLVLRGTLKKVAYQSLAMTPDKRALEWRIWTTAQIVVEERKTGRVVWKRGTLKNSEEYRTTAEAALPLGATTDELQLDAAAKRQAFQKLAADMAEQVHDGLLQGF